MAYVPRLLFGVFEGVTSDGARNLHLALVKDPEKLLAWHTIFMMLTMLIVSRGVQRGLENRYAF